MRSQAWLNRWLWLCPVLALFLAAAVLWLWGLTPWSAILAALLLVCPALIVWGALKLRGDRRASPD